MRTYVVFLFLVLFPVCCKASVMAEVYQTLSDRFIRPIDFKTVSIETIQRVEPQAELRVSGKETRITYQGQTLKSFETPKTPIEWGDVVGASLFQMFKQSKRLSSLTFDEVEWVYVNTLLSEVDPYSYYTFKGVRHKKNDLLLMDKQISVYSNAYLPLAQAPEVSLDKENKILRIRVLSFSKDISKVLEKIIKDTLKEMPDLKGLILDLRSNSGGSLEEAAATADLFLSSGVIIQTRGKHKDAKQVFIASPDDILKNKAMIILINEGTASSAEIVAASLHEHRRAVLIGTRTFGKGTVQSIVSINDKHDLAITWATAITPLGSTIDKKGIIPDLFVRDSIVKVATKLISDSKK